MEWNRSGRNALANALMGSSVIEVGDVFADPVPQLSLAQNKSEIQALAAQTAQEALAHRIGTGRSDGRVNDLDPNTGGDAVEGCAILAVMIMKKRGPALKVVASGNCCAAQTSPGRRVTATWTTRRDAHSRMTHTKMSRNQKSCVWRKSHAQIASAW